MLKQPEAWKRLAPRFVPEQPRKILSLDGGGIRGLITLRVLKRIEQIVKEQTGTLRLCDYFDYIGGTSTGAIIAAGLALGKTVDEILSFYKEAGAMMFDEASVFERWLRSSYKADPLIKRLQKEYGAGTTLSPDDLECLLLIVTRNATTDSPWPVSSNPDARYCATDRPDCNLRVKLWQLVRASTAAPTFFPPEVIQWDKKDVKKSFVFVDGGTTPYNNPAFLLYRMATLEPYNLQWQRGEQNLLIISVGTGAAPGRAQEIRSPEWNKLMNVKELVGTLMYSAMVDQDINCRTLGHCTHGDEIDREIGDLCPKVPATTDLGRAFLYARYNAELTEAGLARIGCGNIDPGRVRELDAVAAMEQLITIGDAVAATVDAAHFGTFLGKTRP
ncbi:MAG TPA: patatin-like phospholipase family protein [Thermoanaerobaculia bacterium]|jgi:hypothetical protein|nr:patatin-like phospholipase family protein [Thermoanaerobaculia bacterium]